MTTTKGKKGKRGSGQGDAWPTMMGTMNKMEKVAPMPDFEKDQQPPQLRKFKSISPKTPKLK